MSTEPALPDTFEPLEFWDEHKNKILIYGILILLIAGICGVYQIIHQRRTAEAETLYAQAATTADFQTIVHDYAGSRVAGDAVLRLAEKLRGEKKYDEAVALLRESVEKYGQHPLISGFWTSLASTYEMQGKLDEALDAYQQSAAKFPEAYTTPLAMAAQGRIFVQKDRKEEARRIYQDIVARYPQSAFGREAMRELRFLKQ